MVAAAVDAVETEAGPRSLLFQWHLTERCNLRCAHCYQAEPPTPELGYDDQLAVLDQLRDLVRGWQPGRLRSLQLTFTGGEPLLCGDLLRLLTAVRADPWPWTISLLTNGTLLDAAFCRELARLRPAFVQVSLDGLEPTHDAARGPGSFAAAVTGLRRLRAAGVPSMVSFTAHRGNWREFPGVAALAVRLGAQRVWADRLIPAGRGAQMTDALLSPAETLSFVELVAATRRRWSRRWWRRTDVAAHRALQFLAPGGGPIYRCHAGDSLLTLLPNGELLPCRRLPMVVGNVLRTPLAELYGHPLLADLRDQARLPADCAACGHRAACGGGLRCLAYAVTGDPHAADPGCPLA